MHPTDEIHATTRRINRLAFAIAMAGLVMLGLSLASLGRAGGILLATAVAQAGVVAMMLILFVPNRSNRIADRVHEESNSSYVRRQRLRIVCYCGFAATSVATAGLMMANAVFKIARPYEIIFMFVLSACFMFGPDFFRPDAARGTKRSLESEPRRATQSGR